MHGRIFSKTFLYSIVHPYCSVVRTIQSTIFTSKVFNASALSPLSLLSCRTIHRTTVEMFHNLPLSAAFNFGTTEEEADPSLHESTAPHHAERAVVCIFPPHFPVLSESLKKMLIVQVGRFHPPVTFTPRRARAESETVTCRPGCL